MTQIHAQVEILNVFILNRTFLDWRVVIKLGCSLASVDSGQELMYGYSNGLFTGCLNLFAVLPLGELDIGFLSLDGLLLGILLQASANDTSGNI